MPPSSKTPVSGHWLHYRNRGTEGFDVEWSRANKPPPLLKSAVTRTLNRLSRARAAWRDPFDVAFSRLWPAFDYERINGEPVPIAVLAANFALTIREHIQEVGSVLEIGAGSGYLSHYLARLYGAKITIIDLPEVIPYTRTNLGRLGTTATFLTPDEMDDAPAVDLAVNTASFQEMLPETINAYFDLVRDRAEYFYCCNRVEKWIGREAGGEGSGDIPVRFAEYPWYGTDILYRVSRIHKLLGIEPAQERLVRRPTSVTD